MGASQLLQHGLGHSTGTRCCRAQLGGEATDFALTGSVASKPARGRPTRPQGELICREFVTPARYLRGCISPHAAQVPRRGKPCRRLWTAHVELQARVLTSHQRHGVSRGGTASEASWSMDEKPRKYWQGHLFPAVLNSCSELLMTREIFSGKETLTWPPVLERFLAHYNLCALRSANRLKICCCYLMGL